MSARQLIVLALAAIVAIAALFLMRTLGWPWRAMTVAGIVPAAILDRAYDIVARHRYQVFGRYDTCPIPDAEHRARFIDLNRGS